MDNLSAALWAVVGCWSARSAQRQTPRSANPVVFCLARSADKISTDPPQGLLGLP